MAYLWAHGPLSAVDLHSGLSDSEDLAYTTVHTELTRLLQKGLLRKCGRALNTRYATTMTREDYLQATVRQTIADLIGSHGASAIHGFVELVAEDEASLVELQKALSGRTRR